MITKSKEAEMISIENEKLKFDTEKLNAKITELKANEKSNGQEFERMNLDITSFQIDGVIQWRKTGC